MRNPEHNLPVTILYRGDLFDTATLVGLANMRIPVGMIAFTGVLTTELKQYIETVNSWLLSNGLPKISIHPNFDSLNLNQILASPYRDWGWGEQECKAALNLVRLPYPPARAC